MYRTHWTLKSEKASRELDYFQSHGDELPIFKLCERHKELIQQYNEWCDTQLMMSGSQWPFLCVNEVYHVHLWPPSSCQNEVWICFLPPLWGLSVTPCSGFRHEWRDLFIFISKCHLLMSLAFTINHDNENPNLPNLKELWFPLQHNALFDNDCHHFSYFLFFYLVSLLRSSWIIIHYRYKVCVMATDTAHNSSSKYLYKRSRKKVFTVHYCTLTFYWKPMWFPWYHICGTCQVSTCSIYLSTILVSSCPLFKGLTLTYERFI